jgi:hypothetical protein
VTDPRTVSVPNGTNLYKPIYTRKQKRAKEKAKEREPKATACETKATTGNKRDSQVGNLSHSWELWPSQELWYVTEQWELSIYPV